MVELGFPELTTERIECLCKIAEETSRRFILSKVASKDIERMDISVEVEGSKPVDITVEIDLLFSKQNRNINEELLVKEAINQAYTAIENFLRKTK